MHETVTTITRRTRLLGATAAAVVAVLALGGAGSGAGAGAGAGIVVAPDTGAGDTGELIVRFRPGTTSGERAAVVRSEDARVVQGLGMPGVNLLRLDDDAAGDAVAGLEAHDDVLWAEPNRTGRWEAVPNDPLFTRQWGLHNSGQPIPDPPGGSVPGVADADIDAPEAWARTVGDPGVVVAIVDSGVAYDHPDLAPNIWHNPGESGGGREANGIDDDANGFVDDTIGWDFADSDADPRDLAGHGTEVAGVVGARGGDGIGVTGVNQRVGLMVLRSGADAPDSAAVAAAFTYAARMGAKVVNASLTLPPSQAISDAIAAAPGVLFVVAAGNQGGDVESAVSFPCTLPAANLICVASTDQDDALAPSSNRGAVSVDLGAPGVAIWTTGAARSVPLDETWQPANPFGWSGDGTWARVTLPDGTTAVTDSPAGEYADDSDTVYGTAVGFSTQGGAGCSLRTTLSLDVPAPDALAVEAAPEGGPFTRLAVLSGRSTGVQEIDTRLTGLDGVARVLLRYRLITDGAVSGDGATIRRAAVTCFSSAYKGTEFLPASGTSFASPMTAGVAALAWAAAPRASAAQVRAAILGGVDAIPSLTGVTVTGGRLNAANALANIAAVTGTGARTAAPVAVRRVRFLGARLRGGRRASLKVKCPATATGGCRGTLVLRSVAVPRRRGRAAIPSRVLVRAPFSVRAGRTRTVGVTLSRASLRRLVRVGRRATLMVTTRSAAAPSVVRIRIRVAPARTR